MVRLADGDRDAFSPLFEALWPMVRRFALRALEGSADAEDAAQVALMKVFSNAAKFDANRDAVTWVLGIVAYECRTFRQKRRRRREEHTDVSLTAEDNPESAVIGRDLQ